MPPHSMLVSGAKFIKDKKTRVVSVDHHSTEQWRKISIEKIEQKQQ